MTIRRRFFRWIKSRIAKVPEGTIMPWWLIAIKAILFPIEYLRWRWVTVGPIKVDFNRGTVTIYGKELTCEFIERLK